MSLFISRTPDFEKVAYEKLLEKDPTSWPVGIIKEAYNQLPYLKDYELEPESEAEAMQNMMEFGTAAAVFGSCIHEPSINTAEKVCMEGNSSFFRSSENA